VCHEEIIGLYDRHAWNYDRDRYRGLIERQWLNRFVELADPSEPILDLGCGVGEPIARFLMERGYAVVGVDSSPTMIEICRTRFPGDKWLVEDMRRLHLGQRFGGIIAWDSFFHLHMDDQRKMFERFNVHAHPGAPLLFTSGPSEGESIGSYRGEPLYHASLDPAEYEQLLTANGFSVQDRMVEDPECGGHTVWLATRTAAVERDANHSA
jgi:SAM-dependent methyltransferase